MRILVLLLALFPASVFAGIGDTYVCVRTEINNAGYRDEFILTWNAGDFRQQLRQVEGSLTGTFDYKIDVQTKEYFASFAAYRDGHMFRAFDGTMFTQTYVTDSYTYTSEYFCPKF